MPPSILIGRPGEYKLLDRGRREQDASGLFDDESRATDLDDISAAQLAASSGFDFAIHFDFAPLDQQLRLPAGAGQAAELQELIQPQFVGWR